jgi:hypothetical protein
MLPVPFLQCFWKMAHRLLERLACAYLRNFTILLKIMQLGAVPYRGPPTGQVPKSMMKRSADFVGHPLV